MSTSDQSASQSRVDPKTIQQWRDRQLRTTEKPPSKAEKLAAEQKMVDLLNKPQRLTGLLSRPAASGGTVMVLLFKPYRGLTSIPAIAIDGCDTLGKVTLLKDKDDNWYAIGKGKETVRKDRDIERSSDPGKPSVTGEIAYCYSVFIQRRTTINQPYKWFWQVFVGGWQSENILVKEWEVPSPAIRTLKRPHAIVDIRSGTFYVSLQYCIWDTGTNASQQRYSLLKGTRKEDVEAKWDKSMSEMLATTSITGASLTSFPLSPRGFGYWSDNVNTSPDAEIYSFTDTTYEIWNGTIAEYVPITTGTSARGNPRRHIIFIPQGGGATPKPSSYFGELNSAGNFVVRTELIPVLHRLSEDGLSSLAGARKGTANTFTDRTIEITLQDRIIYTRTGPLSALEVAVSGVPIEINLDMPVGGGSLPFLTKNAEKGNDFNDTPPRPAVETGDVVAQHRILMTTSDPFFPRDSFLPVAQTISNPSPGSPYLTDVHDKYISAILCPDLLNRGTTETQNIHGDLSPICPIVASAGDLTAMTGMESGVSFGVTSLSKVFTFNISSTAAVDGTTVINAAGGFGRWVYNSELAASTVTPDDKKLPGELLLSDIFPELKGTPPPPEWIGYKNIEHENRTVKVYLWKPELTTLFQEEPVEVEVQKIDAVKKIIDDETLQQLLTYSFFNASFG